MTYSVNFSYWNDLKALAIPKMTWIDSTSFFIAHYKHVLMLEMHLHNLSIPYKEEKSKDRAYKNLDMEFILNSGKEYYPAFWLVRCGVVHLHT